MSDPEPAADRAAAVTDPETERIGRVALTALERTGGASFHHTVEVDKRLAGTALFTTIHRHQCPAWLAEGAIDAAVVGRTEAARAIYQRHTFGPPGDSGSVGRR